MRATISPKLLQRPIFRRALIALLPLSWAVVGGCQPSGRQTQPNESGSLQSHSSADRSSAKPVRRAKPLVDFGKGAGGFPLAHDGLPLTREALVESLTEGYLDRVKLDVARPPVIAIGDEYPKLDTLAVDLSGGRIKPAFRPGEFKSAGRFHPGALHVGYLSYSAAPLKYIDGETTLRIAATDVTLALLRGRNEQATLVMTDASDGLVDFEVSLKDLRRMFLAAAKSGGNRAGYNVRDVKIDLTSDASRSLAIEMKVSGFWLLLPASFKLTGRIDIDDAFDAHLSGVSCSGEDVGGALLAGFIDRAIKKYDGRVMPLVRFPRDRIRLRTLRVDVDESLRLHATFGSDATRTKAEAESQ